MQNNGSSLAVEEKVYSLDIHLDLHKGGNEHDRRRTVVNLGMKVGASLKEGQEIN